MTSTPRTAGLRHERQPQHHRRPDAGEPQVPAVGRVQAAMPSSSTPCCTTRPPRTTRASGRARRPSCSTWTTEWDTICEWDLPFAKWFVGGQLNVTLQLPRPPRRRRARATRSRSTGRASPATPATITYAELLDEVQRFANALKGLGVAQGRPGQHLPADDPRGGGGDAGLRPHRRGAQRRVRRLLVASRWPTASTTPRPRC